MSLERSFARSGGTDGGWQPADHGLLAWSSDPALAINTQALTGGTVYLVGVVLRTPQTVTSLWCSVTTAATTPTAGQNFMGLYSAGGALLSSGAATYSPTGARSTALDAAQACPAGRYWVAVLANAATPPTLGRAAGNSGSPPVFNTNLAAATLRFAVNGTGQTALPASITPASNTSTGAATLWVAVS